jgi:hypothetical protein
VAFSAEGTRGYNLQSESGASHWTGAGETSEVFQEDARTELSATEMRQVLTTPRTLDYISRRPWRPAALTRELGRILSSGEVVVLPEPGLPGRGDLHDWKRLNGTMVRCVY